MKMLEELRQTEQQQQLQRIRVEQEDVVDAAKAMVYLNQHEFGNFNMRDIENIPQMPQTITIQPGQKISKYILFVLQDSINFISDYYCSMDIPSGFCDFIISIGKEWKKMVPKSAWRCLKYQALGCKKLDGGTAIRRPTKRDN